MLIRHLAVGAGLLISLGCRSTSSSVGFAPRFARGPSDKATLMQASRDWSRAAAAGDVEKVLSYWADTAIILQPHRRALVGKPAIRKMVVGSMKMPGFSISWTPERAWVSLDGDVGYVVARNKVSVPDSSGKVHTHYGKAVTVWTKDENGHWKNVVDSWNGNPTEKLFAGS